MPGKMATDYISSLERNTPNEEKTSLLARRDRVSGRIGLFTSTPSRHGGGLGRCIYWTTSFCGVAFILLGACTLSLGIVISKYRTSAYTAGGGAELVLGACLLLGLMLECSKCPRPAKSTGDCVLFIALTLLFLLWCAAVCSYCVALVFSALNYNGDRRELSAILLSSLSLLLTLVFGGSVCCWAGCPAD